MSASLLKRVFLLATLWYIKASSLPKLYYSISRKRDVSVRACRKLEALGHKAAKQLLDIDYWERCLDLGLCPKFLRFQAPNLPQYANKKNIYDQVVRNALCTSKKDHEFAVRQFNYAKRKITTELSFMEKHCLLYLLSKSVEKRAKSVVDGHNKKTLGFVEEKSR